LNVFYAGHYATETVGVQALAGHLRDRFQLPWTFLGPSDRFVTPRRVLAALRASELCGMAAVVFRFCRRACALARVAA